MLGRDAIASCVHRRLFCACEGMCAGLTHACVNAGAWSLMSKRLRVGKLRRDNQMEARAEQVPVHARACALISVPVHVWGRAGVHAHPSCAADVVRRCSSPSLMLAHRRAHQSAHRFDFAALCACACACAQIWRERSSVLGVLIGRARALCALWRRSRQGSEKGVVSRREDQRARRSNTDRARRSGRTGLQAGLRDGRRGKTGSGVQCRGERESARKRGCEAAEFEKISSEADHWRLTIRAAQMPGIDMASQALELYAHPLPSKSTAQPQNILCRHLRVRGICQKRKAIRTHPYLLDRRELLLFGGEVHEQHSAEHAERAANRATRVHPLAEEAARENR
eukprot:6213996-Pleurochrysis_carterae.AAC.3